MAISQSIDFNLWWNKYLTFISFCGIYEFHDFLKELKIDKKNMNKQCLLTFDYIVCKIFWIFVIFWGYFLKLSMIFLTCMPLENHIVANLSILDMKFPKVLRLTTDRGSPSGGPHNSSRSELGYNSLTCYIFFN